MKTETKTRHKAILMLATLLLMLTSAQTTQAQAQVYLSLDPNYGEEAGVSIPVGYDYISGKYEYTLSATTFTREGHTLLGWSTVNTAPAIYGPNEAISWTSGNLTLYAIWDDTPLDWSAVPDASYSLSPTAYTLTDAGNNNITCTLTSLVMGKVWNTDHYEQPNRIVFHFNDGSLSDGNGHSINFTVDDDWHFSSDDPYQVNSSVDDWFVMPVYINPSDYVAAVPGTYTGTLTYDSRWIGGWGNVYGTGASGSIALTLVVPDVAIGDGDDITALSALDGETRTVALNRSFPAGKKQTVCLPFAPTALLSHGKVWAFTGIEGGKAVMTEITDAALLQANTPYIFEANGSNPDVTSILFPSTTISIGSDPQTVDAGAGFTFHGTYTQKTWEADEAVAVNIYGFMMQDNDGQQAGQFVKARRKTILRPFSCYLEYTGTGDLTGTQNAAARRTTRAEDETLPDVIDIVWVSAPGSTTSIHATGAVTTQRDGWYSLDGRRLSGKPSVKGVYINNGRKVVIK